MTVREETKCGKVTATQRIDGKEADVHGFIKTRLTDTEKYLSCFPPPAVLVDQLTQSRLVTYDPFQLQQRMDSDPPVMVLMEEKEPERVKQRVKQRVKRRSVWTRLGWRKVTRRRANASRVGFWSFKNKYRFRARFGFRAAYRRRVDPRNRLRQLKRRNIHKLTAGRQPHQSPRRGGANKKVPTKKQLDAQLDDYMSLSKNRLDKQLDDYMSLSRSRLDAELDEYMSMAGQTPLHWA